MSTALHWGRRAGGHRGRFGGEARRSIAWKPQTAAGARENIPEVIEFAEHGALDIARSRAAEQEVLNLIEEPQPGEIWLADLGTRRQDASRRHCFSPRP